MRDPWEWQKEDLQQLIGQSETLRLEFKEFKLFDKDKNDLLRDLTREVSAFANTEGGVLVVGIKESKDAKRRIAVGIDDGVELGIWSAQSLQQAIEAHVSPLLTGLRVRPIPLDDYYKRCAFVISIPQGNTAYQAKDYLYYGRSEYEIKALPDHEIRLRMFRGKIPNAVVRLSKWHKDADDGRYRFSVLVKNTGEIDITRFKLRWEFSPENCAFMTAYSNPLDFLDGEYDPVRLYQTDAYGQPMKLRLNIYPGDEFEVNDADLIIPPEELRAKSAKLIWTIYLANTIPVNGEIDLAAEFERIRVAI